jgi:hypothetical protein
MRPIKLLLMLVLSTIVLAALTAPILQAQTSSAPISQPSATPVSPSSGGDTDAALRRACSDALGELKAARVLITAQGTEIDKLKQLADLQSSIETGLKNLRTLDAAEKQALRDAIDAAGRETSALKSEIVVLKKERMTFWKKLKYVAIGVGAGAILMVVMQK